MRKTADVVVIGGGNAGTSVAYHLAKLGVKNVVVVEQQYTPFGGSGRCAAQFRQQFATESNLRLALLSTAEFDVLGEETGFGDLEIDKHGYLLPAYTPEQVESLKYNVAMQRAMGIDSYVLDQKQCKETAPYLEVGEVLAGSYCTGEGVINPMKLALAYKKGAEDRGVEFNNYTSVTGFRIESGKIKGVVTDKGEIATDCVVNAAGEWGKFIGRMAGVSIPVEPEKHQIVVTEPLEYIRAPMIYSLYKYGTYITQVKHGGFLMGWSDPDVEAGIIDFQPEWKFLEELSKRIIAQVPALANVRIVRHWAGQYGNCPDHGVVVGAVPEVEGFICALGCTKGTMFAPAIGILAAECAVGVETTLPMETHSIDRFAKGNLIIDPALL
ncbi:FAD-binding oxidoreductase [Agathobaculum sp. NTUH-O15-33]|uniref:NAD(P)/FAD-dependent oxidoreductase n=1 Tax=Agathobaculum sp. NTUH-O15-33 TaxID=3079302 RepID=UPI002958361E|nr:FAD-binding oxidoreductase [Agathobaculum sp. NTUH-O15-33]WNX86410.1 FAD-binding oxidoreductase [Agathobaculum sp. NTUH-O15-33]